MVLAFISEENCVIFAFGTAQNMKLNDSSGIDNLQQIASKKLKKWFKTCFLWSKYSF